MPRRRVPIFNNVPAAAILSRMNGHLAGIDVAVIASLFHDRVRNQSQSRRDDVTFLLHASFHVSPDILDSRPIGNIDRYFNTLAEIVPEVL